MPEQRLRDLVRELARTGTTPAGLELPVLPHAPPSGDFIGAPGDLLLAALDQGVTPERYLRLRTRLSPDDLARLARSRAALVGLGGLGGYVLEFLARSGLGMLRGADGDVFEPSNLNRQLLATEATLGQAKAEAARQRVALVNPAVRFEGVASRLDAVSLPAFLEGMDLAVDALGGLADRPLLQAAAQAAGLPLVTAAVAGDTGIVVEMLPGRVGLAAMLFQGGGGSAAEDAQGTPAWTVALAASLQARLAVRRLLHPQAPPQAVVFDLADLHFQTLAC